MSGSRDARFVPEKALLDWIWLGNSEACPLLEPNPRDIDLDKLDLGKVGEFAKNLEMSDRFAHWLAKHPNPNKQAKEILNKTAFHKNDNIAFKLAKRRIPVVQSVRDRARARGLSR